MTLLNFTEELSEALIHARQPIKTPSRGRPTKRSLQTDEQEDKENKKKGKTPATPLPCADVRYDATEHWPIAVHEKKRCRFCQAYCCMMCSKCKIYVCLVPERNCFGDFHTK